MNKHMTSTQIAIVLEDYLQDYTVRQLEAPTAYDSWNYARHVQRLREIAPQGVASYYERAWRPIIQRLSVDAV